MKHDEYKLLVNSYQSQQAGMLELLIEENRQLQTSIEQLKAWDKQVKLFTYQLITRHVDPACNPDEQVKTGHAIDALLTLDYKLTEKRGTNGK